MKGRRLALRGSRFTEGGGVNVKSLQIGGVYGDKGNGDYPPHSHL